MLLKLIKKLALKFEMFLVFLNKSFSLDGGMISKHLMTIKPSSDISNLPSDFILIQIVSIMPHSNFIICIRYTRLFKIYRHMNIDAHQYF